MRTDRAFAAAVGGALLVLYAACAPHGVQLEDDGNFILASATLGVAHPPGYPLHTLLGKLFTLLPVGTVAWRVHLLSAACGALACALLWMCARRLLDGRLAATVCALALGLSPVFWSQAVIAEVYTLNAALFLGMLLVALSGGPLWALALLFPLALSNHWPLTLLVAPALAILLWPRRGEALRRAPLLGVAFAAGLLPYAWMVLRSQASPPISFAGPLESLAEIWFFVSRAGYADVDASASAGWADRSRYFAFLGGELLRQFAVAGTVLAAVGFHAQWERWGRRVAAALTLAFAMPSAVLLLLLGFDYDAFYKHVFHVYPLPAYAVAALWLGLGMSRALDAARAGAGVRAGAATLLVAAIFAVGAHANLDRDYGWVDRYARTLLAALPPNAVVLLKGADVGPVAYVHLLEGVRPDVTLYHPGGLVLGNRLFHPYRTAPADQEAAAQALVARAAAPVATTAPPLAGLRWHDRWLFATLEGKAALEPAGIPPALHRFYAEHVRETSNRNAYVAFYQGELRRRYVALAAQRLAPGEAPPAVPDDFYAMLGGVEGLLANPGGYRREDAARWLEGAARRMPADASKQHRARFLELRAYFRLGGGDRAGARADLLASAARWPVPANGAFAALARLGP